MPWSTRSRKSSRSAPSNRNPPIEEALTPPQQEYFFPGRFLLGEIPVQLPKYGLREPAADASPRPWTLAQNPHQSALFHLPAPRLPLTRTNASIRSASR